MQEKKNKRRRQGTFVTTVRRMSKNKGACIGFVIICFFAVIAILAPIIEPYDYAAIDLMNKCQAPSLEHLLGTDDLGRDILSRLMYGARYSLIIGICAVSFSLVGGCIFGALAGYFGGAVDMVTMRLMDILASIPNLLLAICISAVLGPGFWKCVLALGIAGIPTFSRLLRASMLSAREMEYVEAATSINCSNFRIVVRHVIPNCMAPLIVQASMGLGHSLIMAASLSYIGLGVQPPTPEWGAMLSGARTYMRQYPYMVIIPGIAILLTVLAMNLMGDALRDALDPKLKQ